jgi:hypothetical protein
VSRWRDVTDPRVCTLMLCGLPMRRKECNYRINLRFQLVGGDWMLPYVNDVAPLLDEAGVRVLIYAGAHHARAYAWTRVC